MKSVNPLDNFHKQSQTKFSKLFIYSLNMLDNFHNLKTKYPAIFPWNMYYSFSIHYEYNKVLEGHCTIRSQSNIINIST